MTDDQSSPELSPLSDEDLLPARELTPDDADAFNHEAIARNLAYHATNSDTPLNIALYGPWGSGKSSAYELLRRRLDVKNVRLVKYIAWRYGGASLQRNFISHAANQLGFKDSEKNHRYHGGLYQSTRTATIGLPEWRELRRALLVLAVGLVALLAVAASVAFFVSYATKYSPSHQVDLFIRAMFVPAGILALLAAASKAVLDGAKVELNRSQPAADEEFVSRFDQLVTAACKKHGVDRIVFFIDELDRCSSDDVVATLTTIKTFLDHEQCVFIVSADREALEVALASSLKQATPANPDNPYYSSASSFLDKIFHHQFFLPPLRTMRLTRFARDLVSDRGGLWKEIRDHGGQRLLDRVIYALVPSHVVSPRRVKALLNNFATNARTVQERGIAWIDRAPEVAKLTVLQTEFPSLAADLHIEPRLPDLLLDPPAEPSERAQRLLVRHGVVYEEGKEPVLGDGTATDPVIAQSTGVDADDAKAIRGEIVSVQNRDLRRYLQRTKGVGIGGPGRDLLYLEGAGTAHDLNDLALSEIVEGDAPESPDTVIEALVDRTTEDRIAVAQVLADMVDQEFGEERRNVLTALMGVVGLLGDEVDPIAGRVADSIRSFQEADDLGEDHLLGALRVAVRADGTEALTQGIAADDRLYADPENTKATMMLADKLPDGALKLVQAQVAEAIDEHPEVLSEPLRKLPLASCDALLQVPEVRKAIQARYTRLSTASAGEADAYIEELYSAATAREDPEQILRTLQWLLLNFGTGYTVVRAHAEQVMSGMSKGPSRDSHALRGMSRGDPADWPFWGGYLSDGSPTLEWRRAIVSSLFGQIIQHASEPGTGEVAAGLAAFATDLNDEQVEEVATILETQLNQTAWWNDEPSLDLQREVHQVARELSPATTPALHTAVSETLAADVLRATQPTAISGVVGAVVPISTAPGLVGVGQLGIALPGADVVALGEQVRGLLPTGDGTVDTQAVRTLLVLARAARQQGTEVDLGSEETLLDAITQSGVARNELGALWLSLDPEPGLVVRLATQVGASPTTLMRTGLAEWANRCKTGERTAALAKLLEDAPQLDAYIEPISRHGVDDAALTQDAATRLYAATRADQRQTYVDFIRALVPSDPVAQRTVADIMVSLLQSDTKVDFDLALRAADALGNQHRSADRLREALDGATSRKNFKIPPGRAEALARAGIKPKHRSLSESAQDGWKSIKSRFGL